MFCQAIQHVQALVESAERAERLADQSRRVVGKCGLCGAETSMSRLGEGTVWEKCSEPHCPRHWWTAEEYTCYIRRMQFKQGG